MLCHFDAGRPLIGYITRCSRSAFASPFATSCDGNVGQASRAMTSARAARAFRASAVSIASTAHRRCLAFFFCQPLSRFLDRRAHYISQGADFWSVTCAMSRPMRDVEQPLSLNDRARRPSFPRTRQKRISSLPGTSAPIFTRRRATLCILRPELSHARTSRMLHDV